MQDSTTPENPATLPPAGKIVKKKGPGEFLTEPLHSRFRAPMTAWYDYLTLAGIILFALSIFAFHWVNVTITVPGVLSGKDTDVSQGYGLFTNAWGWIALAVLVAAVAGIWFVQARGLVSLGAGIYSLAFTVLYAAGVWWKVHAIIGDYESFARSLPLVGDFLGDLIVYLAKEYLDVGVTTGFWLFIPAGALLTAGGLFRYLDGRRASAGEL